MFNKIPKLIMKINIINRKQNISFCQSLAVCDVRAIDFPVLALVSPSVKLGGLLSLPPSVVVRIE